MHWIVGATALINVLILGACQQAPATFQPPVVGETQVISVQTDAPEDSIDGICWGQGTSPALVETVTEQVLVRAPGPVIAPSPDGAPTYKTVQSPAVYDTQTHQKIIKPRSDFWFVVPCPEQQDRAFIATLQRALKSRGLYRGAVTGSMDAKTRKAVRWYQKQHGLDSTTLSLEAARRLGIIAFARADNN